MKLNLIGALGGVLAASLSSVSAAELPLDHAPPELLVVPANMTIMTPRLGDSLFKRQTFDFGSGESGFNELKRVFERQSVCPTGYGSCPNDAGTCCQVGGRCCGGGDCCDAGRWCYGGGCCRMSQNGCDNQGCCEKGQQCCKGGRCCEGGNNCVIIDGKLGCCPIGQTCTGPPTCQDAGYSPCTGENFCCPTGYTCYRNSLGAPMCRNPNAPTTSSAPTSTYVPPPPDPTTVVETTTYVPPPPDPSTVLVATTQTQIVTQSVSAISTPRASSTTRPVTSSQAVETNAALVGAATKSNTGAIAGGVVAGVVAIVAIVIIVIFVLRRNKKQNESTTTTHPSHPVVPPPVGQYNESNSGGIPPTPGSGDPFLTPMAQHQNLGVSYFGGGVPPPSSPGPTVQTGSGSGPYNASQYSGLPEPQQNEASGTIMPQPRYDSTHPRPLPMSIVHSQQPQTSSGGDATRPWSGYAPSPGSAAAAPHAGSNNSQPSGWTAPTNNNGWASPPPQVQAQAPVQPAYTSPPYADGPGRPPSTVYQASSIGAPYSPPGSPPLPDVYGGMAAPSGSSGLPAGAAPPVNAYPLDDKKSYLPYQ